MKWFGGHKDLDRMGLGIGLVTIMNRKGCDYE